MTPSTLNSSAVAIPTKVTVLKSNSIYKFPYSRLGQAFSGISNGNTL